MTMQTDEQLVERLRIALAKLRDSQDVPYAAEEGGVRVEVDADPLCNVLFLAPSAVDRITALREALTGVRPFLQGLTNRGEDRDWRPAVKHLAIIDAVLRATDEGANNG